MSLANINLIESKDLFVFAINAM